MQEQDELTQGQIARRNFALYESEGLQDGRGATSETITVTKHGGCVIVRVPLADIAPADLVFSVCSKSLLFFQLRHDECGDATRRDFLGLIEFPVPVDAGEAQAQLTAEHVILRLPFASLKSNH